MAKNNDFYFYNTNKFNNYINYIIYYIYYIYILYKNKPIFEKNK